MSPAARNVLPTRAGAGTATAAGRADWSTAVCRQDGADPDLWFADDQAPALAACRRCPVLDACRAEALAARPEHGVWAGLPLVELAHLTGRQITHGRLSTYERWKCRCTPCVDAHTTAKARWGGNPDRGPERRHGTHAGYGSGCRCEPCRVAHNAYNREHDNRRRAAKRTAS